jgi:hypothetical protein
VRESYKLALFADEEGLTMSHEKGDPAKQIQMRDPREEPEAEELLESVTIKP